MAPWGTALTFLVGWPLYAIIAAIAGPSMKPPKTFHDAVLVALGSSLYGVPIAYALMLPVALPVHLTFRRKSRHDLQSYCLAGAAVASIPFVPFYMVGGAILIQRKRGNAVEPELVALHMVAVVCGIVCAALFWLIVVRPTRTTRSI